MLILVVVVVVLVVVVILLILLTLHCTALPLSLLTASHQLGQYQVASC